MVQQWSKLVFYDKMSFIGDKISIYLTNCIHWQKYLHDYAGLFSDPALSCNIATHMEK